ncbi:MAG: hypothetical protein AVDCRST_MAG19-1925, partial [uncultured Thermomicrobiales bacterium]
ADPSPTRTAQPDDRRPPRRTRQSPSGRGGLRRARAVGCGGALAPRSRRRGDDRARWPRRPHGGGRRPGGLPGGDAGTRRAARRRLHPQGGRRRRRAGGDDRAPRLLSDRDHRQRRRFRLLGGPWVPQRPLPLRGAAAATDRADVGVGGGRQPGGEPRRGDAATRA